MKKLIIATAFLFFTATTFAQKKIVQSKDSTVDTGAEFASVNQNKIFTVFGNANTWNAIFSQLIYVKERVMESDLTAKQKENVDSAITQINRYFIKQLTDTTINKK